VIRKKNVPRICFLTDNVIGHGNYQTRIWEGTVKAAEDSGIELACVCGGTLGRSPVHPYEKRRNAAYELVGPGSFTGIIVVTTVGSYAPSEQFVAFLRKFSSVPLVCVGRPMSDGACVVEENYSGMKRLVLHFIRDHGKKRIAFIRGPEALPEIEERFRAYRDALRENKISYDPDLTFIGDLMPERGRRAVGFFMDDRKVFFDSLVAVNDNMALGALEELAARGVTVPDEVAVGGYDDIAEAEISIPPLSTVRSPIEAMGRAAVELVLERSSAGSRTRTLSSELRIRESCGCPPWSPALIPGLKEKTPTGIRGLKSSRNAILSSLGASVPIKTLGKVLDSFIEDLEEKKSPHRFISSLCAALKGASGPEEAGTAWCEAISALREKTHAFLDSAEDLGFAGMLWSSASVLAARSAERRPKLRLLRQEKQAEVLRSVHRTIMTIYDMKRLSETILRELPLLGFQRFFLFLYDETLNGKRCAGMVSKTFHLTAAYLDGVAQDLGKIRTESGPSAFFMDLFAMLQTSRREEAPRVLVQALSFREENFGFVVCEAEPNNNEIYVTFAGQLASAIMSGLIHSERLNAEKRLTAALVELEESNRKLASSSIIDDLTGLYNRRGFFTFAGQLRSQAMRMGTGFLLFYGDMDDLKHVNDNHGHGEGDRAICGVAEILRGCFRKSDVISRIGGDEFIVLAPETPTDSSDTIVQKISDSVRTFNSVARMPYVLDISFGFAEFKKGSSMSIESLLSLADDDLYRKKVEKKRSARK
jgi:diguanylate cyclase (GGDEF)-like protein